MRKIWMVFLWCLLIGLAGCNIQKKLNHEYIGKSQEQLLLQMGRPTRVEPLPAGRKIDVYEKSKFLKAAAINTGQFQYDRFESPKALKKEVYQFYFNSKGVIEEVKYEVNYQR